VIVAKPTGTTACKDPIELGLTPYSHTQWNSIPTVWLEATQQPGSVHRTIMYADGYRPRAHLHMYRRMAPLDGHPGYYSFSSSYMDTGLTTPPTFRPTYTLSTFCPTVPDSLFQIRVKMTFWVYFFGKYTSDLHDPPIIDRTGRPDGVDIPDESKEERKGSDDDDFAEAVTRVAISTPPHPTSSSSSSSRPRPLS